MSDVKNNKSRNCEPWNISLTKRTGILREAIKSGKKISVIIYHHADTSTFRYRAYNIFQSLQSSNKWRCLYFYCSELETVKKFFKYISIITIARIQWTNEIQNFIDLAKSCKIRILFDCDDRVFDIDYIPLLTNTLSVSESEINTYWFPYVARYELTAKQADGYIATNTFLANAFETKFGKKAYVVPNFMNSEQLSVSTKVCEKKKKHTKKKFFDIGYFSGSPSHINDFRIIYKQLIQLLEEYDDIRVKVVGFMEFPPEMQKFLVSGRVTLNPLVDFLTLQELMAEVDVSVVPLVVNDFTNCKSELKFFEAAVVDTLTVASRSYTYENSIQNGKTGFLCKPTEWYVTLKNIYLGEYNIQNIIQNAHTYVMKNYAGKKIQKQIETVYETFLGGSKK